MPERLTLAPGVEVPAPEDGSVLRYSGEAVQDLSLIHICSRKRKEGVQMEKRRLELIEAECRRHAALARVDAARRAEHEEVADVYKRQLIRTLCRYRYRCSTSVRVSL